MIRQTERNTEQEQAACQKGNSNCKLKRDTTKEITLVELLFSNAVYHLKLSKEWRGDKSEDSLCASFLIEVKRLKHEIYFIKEVQI